LDQDAASHRRNHAAMAGWIAADIFAPALQ
jgi:hypothetical protein